MYRFRQIADVHVFVENHDAAAILDHFLDFGNGAFRKLGKCNELVLYGGENARIELARPEEMQLERVNGRSVVEEAVDELTDFRVGQTTTLTGHFCGGAEV